MSTIGIVTGVIKKIKEVLFFVQSILESFCSEASFCGMFHLREENKENKRANECRGKWLSIILSL